MHDWLTGFQSRPMSRHAPCATLLAFSDHDGELVQSVGLQPCHYVTQVGSVGRLKTRQRDKAG